MYCYEVVKTPLQVLTPQRFNNVTPSTDLPFNHCMPQYWEYRIPGFVCWGHFECTGTNYIARSLALQVWTFFLQTLNPTSADLRLHPSAAFSVHTYELLLNTGSSSKGIHLNCVYFPYTQFLLQAANQRSATQLFWHFKICMSPYRFVSLLCCHPA